MPYPHYFYQQAQRARRKQPMIFREGSYQPDQRPLSNPPPPEAEEEGEEEEAAKGPRIKCGDEGETCHIQGEPGLYQFEYGHGDEWIKTRFNNPNELKIICDNFYGDLAYGKRKACYYQRLGPLSSTPTGRPWKRCASEDQICVIKGTGTPTRYEFRYGANGKFKEREYTTSEDLEVPCNNVTHGALLPGVYKQCYYREAEGV
jgi:hypothetical protein